MPKDTYFLKQGDKLIGPHDLATLRSLRLKLKVKPTDFISPSKSGPWLRLEDIQSMLDGATATSSDTDRYFIKGSANGRIPIGPLPFSEIQSRVDCASISPTDQISQSNSGPWFRLGETLPQLFDPRTSRWKMMPRLLRKSASALRSKLTIKTHQTPQTQQTSQSRKNPKSKDSPFTVTKSLLGIPVVKFRCPECELQLSDTLKNAGDRDQCPSCFAEVTTPGTNEWRQYEAERESQKTARDKQKADKRKKKESAPKKKINWRMSCWFLVSLVLLLLFAFLISFALSLREGTPSSPVDALRLAAIQAEIDIENQKVEAAREAIRQKAKLVQEFAKKNKLLGLTDLAIIEARGFDSSSTADFDLDKAKKLSQRNHDLLDGEQRYDDLLIEQMSHISSSDDDSALSVFQKMYGISNANAEAACTEWIATNRQPDWNLYEVMAICLRNKSGGIKTEDSAGSFKDQAARVIQRELEALQQLQAKSRAGSYDSGPHLASGTYKDDIDKIIEAKAIVRSALAFPDTARFHNLKTKVNWNRVTLTVTYQNAFGIPKTETVTISID